MSRIASPSTRSGAGRANRTRLPTWPRCWRPEGGASVSSTPTSSRRAFMSCSAWTRQTLATPSTTICGAGAPIEEAAHDVTPERVDLGGASSSIPSSIKPTDIARVMHDGYDVGLLNEGFRDLIKALSLDALLIDTHPGLNEETLLSLAMSNALAIIMRPDSRTTRARASPSRWRAISGSRAWCLVVNKTPQSSTSARWRGASRRPTTAK